ncbi:hypothetical protein [Microbacterium sp. Marseille-Q6648]|uniref:hypothetical protein n=1 Tax=Microbacterium sp. Marseille-Q6648 TaxID=2937991 RepID=UPI0020423C8B|nr:hypothetical protein [Microbacterium sp. Marseille-Q6648]
MADLKLVDPENLRQPDTPGQQDLRGWKFRAKWWNDDTSTVLAWAGPHGCVFHEVSCTHASRTEEPTALCRMDRVREIFDTEQAKGTFRYFGFCGHCLAERIANYNWKPDTRHLHQVSIMRQVLNDVRVLGESAIPWNELITRMKRYDSGDLTKRELKRLVDYYRYNRGDEEDDLTAYVSL